MAKSKLFADWTWRQELPKEFADPSVQPKRTDVFSKYNSTSSKQSSMHAPTLRALLAYAALVNAVEQGDPVDAVLCPLYKPICSWLFFVCILFSIHMSAHFVVSP